MIKFKYTIDLSKIRLNEVEKSDFENKKNFEQHKILFESILHTGISSRYQNGIGGYKQRAFGRILEKLDETLTEFIDIQDAEYDFLKEIIDDEQSRFASQNTRIIMQYRKALDEAVKA